MLVFSASFLMVLAAGGCSKSTGDSQDVTFRCESEPKPPRVGTNTFTITLTDGSGARIVGARVALEGDMSHAGMSPVFGDTKEIAAGEYRGTLDLPMRGDWVVLFRITLTSGRTLEREMKIQSLQAA